MKKRTTKQSVTKFLSPVTAIPVLIPGIPKDFDGLANFYAEKRLQRVKICDPAECLRNGSELNRRVRTTMGHKWNKLIALLQLRDAHSLAREYEMEAAVRGVMKALLPDEPEQRKVKQHMMQDVGDFFSSPARSIFPSRTIDGNKKAGPVTLPMINWNKQAAPIMMPPHFTEEMKDARFVLWYDPRRKRFTPAVYFEELSGVMFALAALDSVRACATAGCGKFFIPHRADQEYHDLACAALNRTRRLRWKRNKKALKGS
jgi:hypothetical protein